MRQNRGLLLKLHNSEYFIGLKKDTQNSFSFPAFVEKFFGNKINKKILNKIETFLIKENRCYLEDTIKRFNREYFNENYNWARFKRSYRRFGSLSSKRNINISYRLLFAPKKIFEYVCVHELAHLKEFNHSKRFWAHVQRVMPEYKQYEKWLKENGHTLTIANNLKEVACCDKNDRYFKSIRGA